MKLPCSASRNRTDTFLGMSQAGYTNLPCRAVHILAKKKPRSTRSRQFTGVVGHSRYSVAACSPLQVARIFRLVIGLLLTEEPNAAGSARYCACFTERCAAMCALNRLRLTAIHVTKRGCLHHDRTPFCSPFQSYHPSALACPRTHPLLPVHDSRHCDIVRS